MQPTPTRIVIADDHYVVRMGLRMVLETESGFEVVGEAWDVASAMRCLRDYRPDVLLLDVYMPGASSVAAIPRIAREFPATAIVVLATGGKREVTREALRRGARGHVLKETADTDLVEAVRAVVDGDDDVTAPLGAGLALEQAQPNELPDGLTVRDAEIVALIVRGHTHAEIAELLSVSVKAVESHRAHIERKLGRTTRAELTRYALDRGLLTPVTAP